MVKDNDVIEFECPVCLGIVRLDRDQVAARLRCPDCESMIDVPPEYLAEMVVDEDPLDLFADLDVDSLAMPDGNGPDPDADDEPRESGPGEESQPAGRPAIISPGKETPHSGNASVSESRGSATNRIEGPNGEAPPNSPNAAPSNSPAAGDESEVLEELDDDDLLPVDVEEADESDSSDQPLRIEGLTEDEALDDVFGIRCHICDTRIHVNRSQIGEFVECPICFTKVKVTPPVDRPGPLNPWTAPARSPEQEGTGDSSDSGGGGDELRLADLDDEPDIEPGFGLEPVEEDLLKPVAAEPDAHRGEGRLVDEGSIDAQNRAEDDEDEFRLAPPVETPEPRPSSGSRLAAEAPRPRSSRPPRSASSTPTVNDRVDVGGAPRSGLVELDDEEKENEFVDFDVPEQLSLGTVFKWLRLVGTSAEFLIRVGAAVALFSLAYSFSEGFFALWNSTEIEGLSKGLGLAFRGGLGGFLWLIGAVGLAIIFGVVFRDSASGRKLNDWPGMAISEWLGAFLFVAFSMWVASLPGLIMGNILTAATDSVVWVIFLTPISIFLLMPICIVSAMFNDSVMNIVSVEILKSLRSQWPRWKRFYLITVALLLIYLVGTGILFLPTFIFSILGAAVQVFAVVAMAAASGLHARAVIDQIMEDD